MTRRASVIYTNAIVGAAVLISTYTGNPWTAVVASTLYVFVIFPRWRSKVFHLAEAAMDSLLKLAARMQKGTRCDPDDPQ